VVAGLWQWAEGLGMRVLSCLGLAPDLARQLIRFGIVGLVAAATYVGVMALVAGLLGQSILLGAFCAFVVATAVSCVGNALWSFGVALTASTAIKFWLITTIGLCLNLAIAGILERLGAHYLVVSLVILIVVPLFNFAGHRLVTFGRPKDVR
jgi:putative flippase GtrA